MRKFKSVGELFSKPDRWCRRALARDKEGYKCNPKSAKAESFCLLGALHRVYGYGPAYRKAMNTLTAYIEKKYGTNSVVELNDHGAKSIRTIRAAVRHAGV